MKRAILKGIVAFVLFSIIVFTTIIPYIQILETDVSVTFELRLVIFLILLILASIIALIIVDIFVADKSD
jgi:hypothetical protein